MLRDLFGPIDLLQLPLAAMLLFLLFFCGVLWRVVRASRATEYRRMASLPLQDDAARRT